MSNTEFSLQTEAALPSASHRRKSAPAAWKRALHRAERQAERGHLIQAVASLQKAIEDGADEYDCWLEVAAVYRSLRRPVDALAAVEKAILLCPRRTPAYEIAMTLSLERKDCDRTIALGLLLLKLSPCHVPAYDMLGAAYMQKGDMEAALRATNALVRLDPYTAAHHFKKALLCQHGGEIALAVQEFMQALALETSGPHSESAREALEILDTYQLNQILTLAMEDVVFRAKLTRDAEETVAERGFYLSDMGNQMLVELSHCIQLDVPEPCRPLLYN